MKEMYRVEDFGYVSVSREGLYYHFWCRVKLPQNKLCRLQLCCDSENFDLGILIPVNDHYELDKKIPVKHLKSENFNFRLIDPQSREKFIPISENEPFSLISQIQNGIFCVRDHIPGLLIRQ